MARFSRGKSFSLHVQQEFRVSDTGAIRKRSTTVPSAISEPVESECRKADWSQLAGKGELSGNQHDSFLESAGSESVAVHSRKLQRWTVRTHSSGPMFHNS